MKNERILNALSRADDKYVEEAAPTNPVKAAVFDEKSQADNAIVTASKRKVYGSRIAAAACACVAVGGLVVWGAVGGLGNLTENPASNGTGNNVEEYAQTNSPESNGYHSFKLTKEELDNCAWSCFIPTYAPEGYAFMEEGTYTVGNWTGDGGNSLDKVTIDIWLDDPVVEAYNPIEFMVEINDSNIISVDTRYPVYDLQTLIANNNVPGIDTAETDKVFQIRCRDNVLLTIGITHPELVSNKDIYKMITSIPYADWPEDISRNIRYLTREEIYDTMFFYRLPRVLPPGYYIAGLSRYTYNDIDYYSEINSNGGGSISLYISNGIEDPDESNYCPIRYTVKTYPADIDTSDKPLYPNGAITAEDIEAAMESGGFYSTYKNTLTEVSIPYPDRVSAEDIYQMFMSATNADNFGYLTDSPTREELYNLPYSRDYAPRLLPDGYDIEKTVHTIHDEDHYWESLDLYISNDIQNAGGDYNLIFFSIAIDSSLTLEPQYDIKTITADDIEKELKQSNEISFKCGDEAVVSINVDKAKLITADELYRMIMSMPISGRFEESGIKTGELPEGVITNNVPVVDINEYYDVQRYPISQDELLGEQGYICGFDGERLYIRDTFRKGKYSDIHSPVGSNLFEYFVVTGESGYLLHEMGAMFWFIYSNGQHVYYNKALLSEENQITGTEIHVFSLESGYDVTMLSLEPNALNCSLPMEDKNEIWIGAEYEGKNVIMRLDMIYGYNDRNFCEVAAPVEYMTPYKDGVLFEMGQPGDDWQRDVYFWDGVNEPFLMFTTNHDFYTVGDTVLFGETVWSDDFTNAEAYLMVYNLSDPSYTLGVPPSDVIAKSDKLYWTEDGGRPSVTSADGMVAEGNGIIYDVRNGWFAHIQSDGGYKIVQSSIDSNALVLFEVDNSVPPSMDTMLDGDIVAVYIVKRK